MKKIFGLLIILGLVLIITNCKKDDNDEPPPPDKYNVVYSLDLSGDSYQDLKISYLDKNQTLVEVVNPTSTWEKNLTDFKKGDHIKIIVSFKYDSIVGLDYTIWAKAQKSGESGYSCMYGESSSTNIDFNEEFGGEI